MANKEYATIKIHKETVEKLDNSRAKEMGKRGKIISRIDWLDELVATALKVFGYTK